MMWHGLRVHYVDVGPAGAPVFLLLHGEPSSSSIYRNFLAPLCRAGFRCVAPDFIGFGQSEKLLEEEWYVIERQVEMLRHLIDALDLCQINLVCQDWGGPIGLRQAVDQPDRFERLFILNTWLHHDGFEYSYGIKWWRQAALDPTRLGGDMPIGRIVAGSLRRPGHDIAALTAMYDAPFPDEASKAGARRFPFCLPFAEPIAGNAADQQRCFEALPNLPMPKHLIFGDADEIFTWEWAQRWHSMLPGSTLDRIVGAGHFVQEDATTDVVHAILSKLGI